LVRLRTPFPNMFLAKVGAGRTISTYKKKQKLFSQGEAADAVFYIQKGKFKVTVLSEHGKEAVIAVLGEDEFCGEGCLAGQNRRMATVTAMTDCEVMRLKKQTMIRALHVSAFSSCFSRMS
jgi:CRP/FNR family transcriptional regulator, cyclic AMP receptor protein